MLRERLDGAFEHLGSSFVRHGKLRARLESQVLSAVEGFCELVQRSMKGPNGPNNYRTMFSNKDMYGL